MGPDEGPFSLRKQEQGAGVSVGAPREGSMMPRREQGTHPHRDIQDLSALPLPPPLQGNPPGHIPTTRGHEPDVPGQLHGAPLSYCGPGPSGHLPAAAPLEPSPVLTGCFNLLPTTGGAGAAFSH